MKRAIIGVLIVVLALWLVGCQSVSEKIGEEIGEEIAGGVVGGDVEVDGDSVTVETDDGAVTVENGEAGELPDGFPDDFPIYDGATVDSASSIAADGDTTFYVNLVSKDAVGDVYDWYKEEFGSSGWEIKSDVMMSGDGQDSAMLSVEKGSMTGTLSVVVGSGGADIGIILVIEG